MKPRKSPAHLQCLLSLFLLTLVATGCATAAVATPAPYQAYEEPLRDPESYLTAVIPQAVQGADVGYDPNAGFFSYQNPVLGILLIIPNAWAVEESPNGDSFSIFPEIAGDRDTPTALINFSYIEAAYDPQYPVMNTGVAPQAISIPTGNGYTLEGISYFDSEFTLPVQNAYVELPYYSGKLLITATYGPYYNMYPALIDLLGSITFQ